jgi:hypothetical protein
MSKKVPQRTIENRLEILEQELAQLRFVLDCMGVPASTWVSVRTMAAIAGLSQNSVLQEIAIAEAMRKMGGEGYLVYGEHYKSNAGLNSQHSNTMYKCNVRPFYKAVVQTPPDVRRELLGKTPQEVELILTEYRVH